MAFFRDVPHRDWSGLGDMVDGRGRPPPYIADELALTIKLSRRRLVAARNAHAIIATAVAILASTERIRCRLERSASRAEPG